MQHVQLMINSCFNPKNIQQRGGEGGVETFTPLDL